MTDQHYNPEYFASQISKSNAKVAQQYGQLLDYAHIEATRYPRFLDAGCGAGPALSFLQNQGFQVVGSDLVLYPLEQARKRSPQTALVNADLRSALPFANSSFEVILASEVIEHLSDADAFLAECWRVLTPGGCLLLTTPNLWDLRRPWASLTRQVWSGYQDPTHINLMTPRRLVKLLHAARFGQVKWKSGVKPWWSRSSRRLNFKLSLPYPPLVGNGIMAAAFKTDTSIKS